MLKKKYGGLRYYYQTKTYIHAKVWIQLKLTYMVDRLSIYIFETGVPVFVGIMFSAQYLNSNLYCTIMYPRSADLTRTIILRYNYSNGQFDMKIACKCLEIFIDSYHT